MDISGISIYNIAINTIPSAPGITWTKTTSNLTSSNWIDVVWTGSQFLALSRSGLTTTSSDGTTWTTPVQGPSNTVQWQELAYESTSGRYLAVAANSDAGSYSDNGTSWTAVTLPNGGSNWYVTAGAGAFGLLAPFQGFWRSTTGATGSWTQTNASFGYRAVTFGNGNFVMTGGSSGSEISADGTTWTASSTAPANPGWWSVAAGNGLYVVNDENTSTSLWYSSNGLDWTEATNVSPGVATIVYGLNRFAAFPRNSADTWVLASTNGSTWTTATLPDTYEIQGGASSGSAIVALAQNTAYGVRGTLSS